MNLADYNSPVCHIELLGPLRVTVSGQSITRFPTRKAAELLGYLALHIGPIPRERIIDQLWPEMKLSAARNNLSTTLVALRKLLEPAGVRKGSVMVTSLAEIGLNPEMASTDAAQFEELAKRSARADSLEARVELLTSAAELYRGDFLAGSYQDWALRASDRYRARMLELMNRLALDLEAVGRYGEAIHAALRCTELDPYAEELHVLLVRLYVAAGRLTDAKQVHTRFERTISDEFGATLEPGSAATISKLLENAPPAPPRKRSAGEMLRRSEPNEEVRSSAGDGIPERPVLPASLGAYFGREAEIVHLVRMLVPGKESPSARGAISTRLVTVTGPGGIGKTRLTLEFARRVASRFGLWCGFVPLADITRPSQLTGEISQALKLTADSKEDRLAPICAFLNGIDRPDSPPILILDNLEHLISPRAEVRAQSDDATVADCITQLLTRVPGLALLCTSRQRIGVRGEHILNLDPLAVPESPPDAPDDAALAEIAAIPSVGLYVDRARASRSDFGLTAKNASAVAALCRQLDGSPLALELAAAWVRVLPPRKMWERLTAGLDIPEGSYADLPARHRTLTAALDWSYRLLEPESARLFSQLSIFSGGFTVEAAAAVCELPDALVLLARLADASLLKVSTADEEEPVRYSFLETVYEYSRRILNVSGELGTLEEWHAAHFMEFAELAESQLRGAEQVVWLNRLQEEHDNILAALDWCYADTTDARRLQTGARIICSIFRFWHIRGYWDEARLYIARAEQNIDTLPDRLRARTLNVQAGLFRMLGDLNSAKECYRASLTLWQKLEDTNGAAAVLHNLGLLSMIQGEFAEARPFYEESLALERAHNNTSGIADELHHLGWVAHELRELAEARRLYSESLALREPLGDLRGKAFTLQNLANVELSEGRLEKAKEIHLQHLDIRRELGDRTGTAAALHCLGNIAEAQGEKGEALSLYDQALEIRWALSDRIEAADSIDTIATLIALSSQTAESAALLSATVALREQLGLRMRPADIQRRRQCMAALEAALPTEQLAAAIELGKLMPWEQAVAAARKMAGCK